MAKTRERYTEHPSIAVIGGKPKLRVFEDFFIEEDLPKWRKIAVKIGEDGKRKSYGTEVSIDGFSSSWENNGSISDRRTDRELLMNAKREACFLIVGCRRLYNFKLYLCGLDVFECLLKFCHFLLDEFLQLLCCVKMD